MCCSISCFLSIQSCIDGHLYQIIFGVLYLVIYRNLYHHEKYNARSKRNE